MKCKRKKPEACFNCPYPDCIDDSYKTADEIVMVLDALKEKKTKPNNKKLSWYRWYEKHPDYMKEYREKNRERIREYRRKYYLEHRADALEKQKLYEARKRQRKAAANA